MKLIYFFSLFGVALQSSIALAVDCPKYWEPQITQRERSAGEQIDLKKASDLALAPEFRPELMAENNDCGQLAWFETRRLEGYLDMYLATEDETYLENFVVIADKIYKANDIFTNKKDHLRNRVVFGWSSIKYTEFNERHVHGVQSGIFAEIYARFSRTIWEKELEKFDKKAEEYHSIAVRALEEVQEDWSENIGFYKFKSRAHKKYYIYPYNQGLAIGSAYLELYNIDLMKGRSQAAETKKQRILAIGEYFKKNLLHDKRNDRYLWRYAPDSYYEDMSHASLDLNFVRKAYESGLLFKSKDIKRFTNTVEKSYVSYRNRYGRYLDGFELEEYTNWHGLTCLMLVDFAQYTPDNSIIENCEKTVRDIIYNKAVIKKIDTQFFIFLLNGLPKLYHSKLLLKPSR